MYKLGVAVAAGLVAYVCAMSLVLIALLLLFFAMEARDGAIDFCLVHLSAVFAAFACLCYIHVARKAARPSPLHWHGAVLMMLLMEIVVAFLEDGMRLGVFGTVRPTISLPLSVLAWTVWGVRRSLFVWLMMDKMSALGPPSSRCSSVRFWGLAGIRATLAASGVGAFGLLYSWYMVVRGTSYEETVLARTGGGDDVSIIDRVTFGILLLVGALAAGIMFVGNLGLIAAARRAMRGALARLVQRGVSEEMLSQVKGLVKQQFVGAAAGLATNCIRILHSVFKETLPARDPLLGAAQSSVVPFVLDSIGDAVGILLLSGIGALMFRENPEAGDIGANIRSKLHAAVLTSRADSVFEGVVRSTASNCCIVSFPGKYIADWNALTWLCEQGHLSSACVFLPKADPKERFGQHVFCPDTPGMCWCHQLYGSAKDWGCAWFEAWRLNVEKAVELGLDLVVVFFPRQSGRGVVTWEQLTSVNLWDGNGLGGSQKAEVAHLNKMGYTLVYESLDQTRMRISRRQLDVAIARGKTWWPTRSSSRVS